MYEIVHIPQVMREWFTMKLLIYVVLESGITN